MSWFNKKKPTPVQQAQAIVENASVEIVAHKDAKAEVVEDTKKANEQLKHLLEANGFTLKIYLAAGGRQSKTHRSTH